MSSGKPSAPEPTLVLLVRHGQTPTTGEVLPGRAPGLHLSKEGESHAEHTAQRIVALGRIDAVYSSPMERTVETATPIAKALGLSVLQHDGLNECDFGDWTGRKLSDLRKLPEWVTVQRNPSGFCFPSGESFAGMQARAVRAINAMVNEYQGKRVVAVSHADVIKAVVASAAGTPLDLFQRMATTYLASQLSQTPPTSHSRPLLRLVQRELTFQCLSLG